MWVAERQFPCSHEHQKGLAFPKMRLPEPTGYKQNHPTAFSAALAGPRENQSPAACWHLQFRGPFKLCTALDHHCGCPEHTRASPFVTEPGSLPKPAGPASGYGHTEALGIWLSLLKEKAHTIVLCWVHGIPHRISRQWFLITYSQFVLFYSSGLWTDPGFATRRTNSYWIPVSVPFPRGSRETHTESLTAAGHEQWDILI